jgi:Flp pilus assembly protein TadD
MVVGFLLVFLAVFGWLVFRDQRRQMLLRNGRDALSRSALEDALVFGAKAVQADPKSADACRLMADASAEAKSPDTVFWRARVARLEPGNIDNFLAWAKAAVDLGRSDWALEALNHAPKDAENRADWQNLVGGVETNLGRFGDAQQHFERAVQIEPGNDTYAVNLASLRLSSPDLETVANARRQLEKFASSHEAGRFALEALLREALNSGDLERARTYSSRLEKRADSTFDDRLLELNAAFHTDAFKDRLEILEQESAGHLGDRIALVYWMIGHGLAKDASEWIEVGSAGKACPVPLQMAEADSLRAQQDWVKLRELLEAADWASNDFIRKALLALCERNDPAFQDRWQDALRSAKGDPEKKFRLGQLVSSWGWYSKGSQLLWDVANTSPIWRPSALSELWRNGVLEKNAGAMLRVAAERYRDSPKNPGTKNNYAFLLLLLNVDQSRAEELAKEAWTDAPLHPDIVATYAYACYKDGRIEDGIKAMEQLAERYRSDPGIALYYAALLAEEGHSEEAGRYLALSDGSPRLLPEEQALATRIKSKTGQH